MNGQSHFLKYGIIVLIFACFFTSVNVSKSIGQESQANTVAANQKVLELLVIDKVTKEPVPDVSLTIRSYQRTGGERRSQNKTDANGKCRIEINQPLPYVFRIETSKKGYVPVRVGWGESSPVKEIPNEYTLALEQGTTIGGIIQDEKGNPVSGASVFILIPSEGEGGIERVAIYDIELKTDANGIWKCDYVPAKLDDIWIRLAHPDYTNDDMFGQTPKPPMEKLRDMTGVMVMKKGLVVKGRVLDAEGQPIRSATISQGSDRFGSEYPQTRADAEGNFIFNNAKPGEMILTVQAFGHAPDLKQIIVTKDMDPIEFRLERGHIIKGRIVDPNGNPVAGAFVAADTWRGHRSLEWRIDTNADGRFQWRTAPSDEVLIDMGKMNYMSIRHQSMTASDEDYVITMYPVLKVHGTVVDANTGQPILDFRLLSGIDWGNGQPIYWQRDSVKTFKQGRYEVTFSEPRDAHLVRIEADGYKPGISQPLKDNEIDITCDFKLEKGTGPSGIVKLPDGRIAEGAEVILCTPGQSLSMNNGRMQQRRDYQYVEVKQDGKFSFPPQSDHFILVILHDDGFLEISNDELAASPELTLKPWSKIDGKLLVGKEPGKNKEVLLRYESDTQQNGINYYSNYETITDENGKFAFERVIPGQALVCRKVRLTERSYTYSHCKRVEIIPGKTLEVTIGGTGRSVKGKVNIPDYIKGKVDIQEFSSHLSIISPNNPYTQMSFKTESDGSFCIDDVPEGSYTLNIYASGPPQDPRIPIGDRIGMVTQAFTISEMPGGRSDEPLNLGALELQVINKEAFTPSLIGKTLPDINDFNISLKQADMQDEPVLICFWDMEQRPSRNCILELNKKVEELKTKDITVIAIQASKTDKNSFNDWIKEYNINIPMGFIETDSEDTRFNWGVKALPWLILTDKQHIVQVEGFSINELDEKIK
ncbi:MAG: redoxin domain-containing protein [Sedimentisphaerales bacterium]|nr:redoxin domain-containing protein [Sedimentisphaerales bacterium]